MHIDKGLLIKEIAAMCEVSDATIRKYLRRYSISKFKYQPYKNQDWLREMYLEKNMAIEDIARLCGVSEGAINTAIKKFGLYKRVIYEDADSVPQLSDKGWLIHAHIDERLTRSEIAQMFGVSVYAVSQALLKFGITSTETLYVTLTCNHCGQEFVRKRRRHELDLRRNPNHKPYCSASCSVSVSNRTRKPVSRARWKIWASTDVGRRTLREAALKGVLSQHRGRETSIEKLVRERLESEGVLFYPQHRIGYWLVDFYLPEYNIWIEVNGDYWHGWHEEYPVPNAVQRKSIGRDKAKATYCANRGITLIWIWEHDINADLDQAFQPVLDASDVHDVIARATSMSTESSALVAMA